MTQLLVPASVTQARTVVLLSVLIASIATILSACSIPASSSDSTSVTTPVTQAQLPAEWPEEIFAPNRFSLEYAVGGAADGRTDFTAQYVAFGNQVDAAASYVSELITGGFALDELRADLGIWVLKGFGYRVEIVVDASHSNLTWLAVSVFTQ